jgi:RNA polymerase sigma-70 factor, ECF subfamily
MTSTAVPRCALIERLHAEHAAELRAHCLRLTGYDWARAEDVAQETLLRACVNASTLDGSHGSVRAWLYRVARNIVIDEQRTLRANRELPVAEVPEHAEPAELADQLLMSWVVAEALERLSPDHRTVVLECYFRGSSVAEAARALGVPPGTVKSRTHYALRALRLVLAEMGVSR